MFLALPPPNASLARAAYLNPSFLYPAAFRYQLESGFIHFFSHGRLLMKGARDGADMVADIRRGMRVSNGWVGCLQLQNVEVVRSSSWSGERSELQLGEVRPPTSSDRRTWEASYSSAATSLSPPVTDFHLCSDVATTKLPAYPGTAHHHTPPPICALNSLPATEKNISHVRPPVNGAGQFLAIVSQVLRGSAH
jgi:hypothetical protein